MSTGARFMKRGLAWSCVALLLAFAPSAGAAPPDAGPPVKPAVDGNTPFPPFRVIGNLYHVGQTDFASYLITSKAGHILINSNYEDSLPIIKGNVEALGFKFTDIKILLGSHAHGDHMAGHAGVQELTGAKIFVMAGDDEVVRNGRKNWKPARVDRVLRDGEVVKLGGNKLVAHLTPGHTRGNTTWSFAIRDRGKSFHAVILGSPFVNAGMRLVNNPDYPAIADDYARTFKISKALPCDIFLGAHGSWFDMDAKYKRNLANPKDNAFIDPEGYRTRVDLCEKAFLYELSLQKSDPKRVAPSPNDQLGPPNRL